MNEVERIRSVYRGYDERCRSQWDNSSIGNQWIMWERRRAMQALAATSPQMVPLAEKRILEIGCGFGGVLMTLAGMGAQPQNLFGVDILPDRIQAAARNYPEMHFATTNAEALDFQDNTFDLIVLFTVLSSILDPEMAENVAGEARRLLKPAGGILWYDVRYSNPRNPHTRPMTLDRIRRLFPNFQVQVRSITLLPPLARCLSALTPALYPALAALSLLHTHYFGLLIKRA